MTNKYEKSRKELRIDKCSISSCKNLNDAYTTFCSKECLDMFVKKHKLNGNIALFKELMSRPPEELHPEIRQQK